MNYLATKNSKKPKLKDKELVTLQPPLISKLTDDVSLSQESIFDRQKQHYNESNKSKPNQQFLSNSTKMSVDLDKETRNLNNLAVKNVNSSLIKQINPSIDTLVPKSCDQIQSISFQN